MGERITLFQGSRSTFSLSLAYGSSLQATIIGHYRGFNTFWHKGVVQHNKQALFWKALLSRGSGGMPPPPPGNLDSRRHIIIYFEVYFYFALLLLEVNQFENLDEKKN